MTFWLKIVLGYLVVAALLVLSLGFDWRTGLDLLVVACGTLPLTIKHIPRLYLALWRLRYYITNAETTWSLTLHFNGSFDAEHLERFVHRLALEHSGSTSIVESRDTRYLIRLRRLFIVELMIGPSYDALAERDASESASLDVTVFDQQIGYRSSQRVLERVFVPLIEQLKDEFGPHSSSLSLRVTFEGTNPFMGLYLQQLPLNLVQNFALEFKVPTSGPGDYVRVSKSEMTVMSSTVEGFRRSALQGLTFSAVSR